MTQSLADTLRQRADAADLQAQNDGAVANILQQEDEERKALEDANGIINSLPAALEKAADDSMRSLDLMKIERTASALIGVRGEVLVSSLPRKARYVAIWAKMQGLTLSIRADNHFDEGQGRAWTTQTLVANW